MKIAFLSTFAFDANVSLINALKKENDIYFVTEALYEVYNYLDINQLDKLISKGSEVKQLNKFKELLPLEKTYVIKGTRNSNIIKKAYNSFKIHTVIRKINPDVILLDGHMLTYIISALFFRNKTLLLIHDPFLHSGENFFIDNLFRKFYFSLVKNKMLLNESQKNKFIKFYKQDPKKVYSSFLGVYDFLKIHQSNQYKSDEFNILFFGRISPYKGIKYLLDAFLMLLSVEKNPHITLTIAGSGSFDFDIKPYQNYPQINIINDFIQPEVLANMIDKSSLVVCPYTDATQSGVVMSAFAFQKPVIATNVGGLPEMVDHGKTGLLVKPKSSEALFAAILKLYKNQNLLKIFSENIEKDYIYGRKSWMSSAKNFMNAFKNIKK